MKTRTQAQASGTTTTIRIIWKVLPSLRGCNAFPAERGRSKAVLLTAAEDVGLSIEGNPTPGNVLLQGQDAEPSLGQQQPDQATNGAGLLQPGSSPTPEATGSQAEPGESAATPS